jgi:hypothetical protein
MPRLYVGGDACVYDGTFRDNLSACLATYSEQRSGYHSLRLAIPGSVNKRVDVDIVCVQQVVAGSDECIVCDECRVMGALPCQFSPCQQAAMHTRHLMGACHMTRLPWCGPESTEILHRR